MESQIRYAVQERYTVRERIAAIAGRAVARTPGLLALLVVLLSADAALAGRQRVAPARASETLPAVPEPGAAIAFAIGVGVVAWAARRNRR